MSDESLDQYPDWGLLQAWVAVVESESVSEAAKRLSLSQAAVSMRVKLLETKLNTTLLDRGTRPAKPTLAGQRLYEATAHLLRNADEMLESVRSVSRAKRSVVRIGSMIRSPPPWGRCCSARCPTPPSRCASGRG